MTESSNLEHQSPHGELRTAFYNPYDIKRRRRTSRSQFKTLEKAFIENPKPNASTRQQLAQRLSMTPRGIQVWFQNRRAKNKQANTAAHQANLNPSTEDQQLEDDVEPEGDPLLVPNESGPIEDPPSYAPSTRTVESSNALGEPPTTNKAQATRADSVTSDFSSSSVLSIESLAVKADTTRLQSLSDDNGSTLDAETWVRSQMWSSAGAHNSSNTFQPAPSVGPFSSPSLSALGPTARLLIDQPRLVDTPVVTRDDWSPGALHKSQDSPRGRNSKTLTFQGLPPAVPTIPIVHRRPSTLSLLRRMSMPATIRGNSDQDGNIWSGQHPSPYTDDFQQSIPHLRPHPYSVNNTNTNNNNVQPPFHPSLPPQPPLSRTTPSIVTSTATTMATTAAITTAMGGTHLSPTVFGHVGFAGDTRGHARTYPLSRRVSIHETSFSSSHHGSRHKAVHSLDGLSSTSTSDGISRTEPIVSPIEVQSKRRKSVSKHFRPSGGSPMAGIHVFDTSGGIVHGDTPSSFSESPTSVNVPSFTFSPPEQQPRIADNQAFERTTSTTNPHTLTESQGGVDYGPKVVWMGGVGVAQQLPLKGDTTNAADSFTATNNGGDFGAIAASPTQQTSSPTVISAGGHSSTQQSHILAGQGTTLAQSSMVTTGEASHSGSLDPRKGRRRSSLKTTSRNKGQSGVRVQFDIQHSPTGPNISASGSQDSYASPMQQGNYTATENVYQDSWINMTMQQRSQTDDISEAKLSDGSSMTLLDPEVQKQSSSPHPPDAPGRSGQTTAFPTSSLPLSATPGSSNHGGVVYWPAATNLIQVGYSGPDSPALDSTLLQDAQQARRNSCPPGFIECFNKGLQIVPDPPSLGSQPLVNQSDIAVLHLQQELEHHLQQQQQQFQQQQLQLQLQHQRRQQLQQQLQQQQYQQQFFFPVQEPQASTAGSSSSSTTMAPKADVDPFNRQEQPFGIVFPEGHVVERREQGFGSTMPTDSPAAPDHETKGSDLDVQELRRAHLSASGHRHSLTDPYHLPQLQTPRLLAQQQHQAEQPPWSRTRAAYSVRPARSRLSLPVTLQDTFGRRYSEPANISKDISGSLTQQGTVPLFNGDGQSSSSHNTTLYQWQSDQDATLGTTFAIDPNLSPKIEETPLSTSLHPLDASASDASDLEQSSLFLPAYASSSHMTATPALGQHIPVDSFPTAMTVSPASSISSSPSPSSSPVASRDIREFPFGNAASSSPMSASGPATYGGPSPPVWGTPPSVAMAVTLSPPIEAPILMRAHSLDSLMLQPSTMRESPSMLVDPNASLASPRRHSQGPSSSVSVEQGPQTHSSLSPQFVRQDVLQTQPSYFPSPVFPPPPPPLSPITFKNPLGVHPLDQHGQQHQQHQEQQRQLQQQRQQQQQHPLQQGQPWNAALPTMFQSTQQVPPHVVQRQQSDTLIQGSPTIVMPHEGFEQNINWDQSLAAMNHFAILQQKLPLARQQQQQHLQQQQQQQGGRQSLHSQPQSTHQQMRLQQLQQQQQHLHQQHQQNQLQQQKQQQLQQQQQIPQPLPHDQAQPLQQHKHQQPLQEHPPSSLSPPLSLAPEPLSGSQAQSFAHEPTSTVPSFKDAKAFEEYKHQQFILEHQRLQQRQELEMLNDQNEAKLNQERAEGQSSVKILQSDPQQQRSRSPEFDDKSTSPGRLSGHVAIATALVPSPAPSLSASALKEF